MESSKVEMIEQAIQQLMIGEAGNKQVVSLPAGDDDGGDQDENRLLLSRLLTQLQTTGNDDGIQQADTSTTTTDTKKQPSTTAENNITDDETGGSSSDNGREEEEIVKELKKVQKQNFITHCLLSAMIFLTITWQVSEVSIILKFKNGINRPFQSIGGMLKDVFKRPTSTSSTSKSSNDQNGGGADQVSSQILAPIQQQIEALPSLP